MEEDKIASANRSVSIWILIGVVMLLIQVILGGITRLTGSGLSITEWDVFTGILPPWSESQWQNEFAQYKKHSQFRLLNADFSLSDFKFIFFWEWFHRFWARLVGIVFLVGFIYLLLKGKLKKNMVRPLLILFLLGALQGAVGWLMVKSGLTGDAVYVEPTRLALHFVFALGLIAYTFWIFLDLRISPNTWIRNKSLQIWTWIILFVLLFQLSYGAMMAGYKAARIAPTWPKINGDWVPPSIFHGKDFWLNFIDNEITVHFIHRGLAYLMFELILVWSWKAFHIRSAPNSLTKSRKLPAIFFLLQVILGILTLLSSPGIIPNQWVTFDWLALLHQVNGLLFFMVWIYMLYIIRSPVQQS
ncbi:MAG: COX15/CtaA family protein [Chitinophagales bacterium]